MNIMLDLETLDTAPSTVILSIGLAAFTDTELGETRYFVPSMQEQITLGRTVSASTIQWWMGQNSAAKKVFEEQKRTTSKNLADVLSGVAFFIEKYPDVKVWSYGANFDVPILQHAFEQMGMKLPWKYPNVRCLRTFCDERKAPYRQNFGVAHNAVDDAISQAKHVIAVRNPKPPTPPLENGDLKMTVEEYPHKSGAV